MTSFENGTFLGPFFIVLCFDFVLYGAFCIQVYSYYAANRDRLALKLLVGLLSILETLHTAFCIHLVYTFLIFYPTMSSKESQIIWSVPVIMVLEPIIGINVRLYYTYRLWKVSQSFPVVLTIISLEAALVALEYKAISYLFIWHTWQSLATADRFSLYSNLCFSFTIFIDSAIASLLVYYFHEKSRSFARTRGTKGLLLKLSYFAMTAGALTVLSTIIWSTLG
ncbi:hypothetical protein BDY19DRAFT_150225 [Irpex rosettiformis]|uniref:Uncharacterized protein n=1 Tax=Irpex rosettiformis TaxID=378272 RepID=A0ACB8U3Q3_9APHY|nr:hypothetical protein BDY19DRAFT_150225 [Irpex rosettiformis]